MSSATDPDNVALARRALEAFNRFDAETFIEDLDPDVEWLPALAGGVEGRVYHRHDGVRQYFRDLSQAWEFFDMREVSIRDLGDRVVMLMDGHARGRGSGVELDQPFGVLLRVHGGRVVWGRSYLDHTEALREAGAAE